jgi:D-glycerate 3-kinase
LGAKAAPFEQRSSPAINEVESIDRFGFWRREIQSALSARYEPFFRAFDAIVYLRAPSWEVVPRWREEQEQETLGRPLTPVERSALGRFIQHYERITRAMLAGAHRANWIVHLDESRNVVSIERRT